MSTEGTDQGGSAPDTSGSSLQQQLATVLMAIIGLVVFGLMLAVVVYGIYLAGSMIGGGADTGGVGLGVGAFAAGLAGLISFLSPCVLPLVPPYLGFLGGTSLDALTGEGKTVSARAYSRVILAAVFFVLGFTTIFVSLGAAASVFGQFIAQHKDTMAMVAGALILVFGLHFLGVIRIPLLYRQARMEADVKPASLIGAYIMGLAFAFGWTPCVGPVLATILTFAASEATVTKGAGLLFVYSLGLGIPFILAAIMIRPFMGFMQKFRKGASSAFRCFIVRRAWRRTSNPPVSSAPILWGLPSPLAGHPVSARYWPPS